MNILNTWPITVGDFGWTISVQCPDQDGSYTYLNTLTSATYEIREPNTGVLITRTGTLVAGTPPTIDYTTVALDITQVGVYTFDLLLVGTGWQLHAGSGGFRVTGPA